MVRALSYAELAASMGALLDVASLEDLAKEHDGAARREKARRLVGSKGPGMFAGVEKVVTVGTVDPKFGTDSAAGPVASDLPLEDQVAAFNAILELSGFSKKNGDQVRP